MANGSWSGLGVVIQSGVTSFLQSLHPGFLPSPLHPCGQWAEGPAFTIGSGGQGHGFLLGTELAARLVSAYAALPAEVGSLLGGFASLCAGIRLAKDQLGAGVAMTGSPAVSGRIDNRVNSSPTDDKDKTNKTQRKGPEQTCQPTTTAGRFSPLTKTAVALGALSGLTATGAELATGKNGKTWIAVADAEALGKIGHDPDYPLNGSYRQTEDINGSQVLYSIGNTTHPFTGQYDGQCHAVGHLRHCLVHSLQGEGRVENLLISGAKIQSTGKAGGVACEISAGAVVNNILAEHVDVATTGRSAHAGIGAGMVIDGIVDNITAVNCAVKTSGQDAHAGIVVGDAVRGTVGNTTVVNCTVKTSGKDAHAGIVVGDAVRGTIGNTTVVNCTVKTSGKNAHAGIGVGKMQYGMVANTLAVNCTATTSYYLPDTAYAGIGAGYVHGGTVSNTAVANCTVATMGHNAKAGIGAGYVNRGTVSNTTAVNCTLQTRGSNANAGIGTGHLLWGTVDNTTAVNCRVKTRDAGSNAGIGTGFVLGDKGTVGNTTAVNCTVETLGAGACAGIGTGYVAGGTVANTTGVNSQVKTSGDYASAGLGAGADLHWGAAVGNTTAIGCTVESFGKKEAKAVINGGESPGICNTSIDGTRLPNSGNACTQSLDHLCEQSAQQLLTPNCQSVTQYLASLDSIDTADQCSINMTFSGLPATTMALPTTAAPLAATLSTGAITGIALGATAFVLAGVAGVCIYRHYHRELSTAVTDDQFELQLIDGI